MGELWAVCPSFLFPGLFCGNQELTLAMYPWGRGTVHPIMQNREAIVVAARAVIHQHGEAAVDHAKRMARRYTKAKNTNTAREWVRIIHAIRELRPSIENEFVPVVTSTGKTKSAA